MHMIEISTYDAKTITDLIISEMLKEFDKVLSRISEERHVVEISFIDVQSMTNRIMMAWDRVMRSAKIFTYQGGMNYQVRPMIEGIVAVVLVDRKVPNVDATKPAVLMVVTTIMADFAAALAVNDSMEKRA